MKPHTKDHTVYDFTGRKCLEQSNPQRQIVYLWLSGAGEGEWGVIAGVHGISFWGNKNVLELDGGMVAQHCEYNKNHCIAHFKVGTITNFMLSVLLHN